MTDKIERIEMDKKDLYESCYLAKNIEVGDVMPMTGSSLYNKDGYPLSQPDVCELDSSAQGLLDTLKKIYTSINTDNYRKQYQEFFSKNNINIPVDVFMACTAVLIGRRKHFANLFADEERAESRGSKYISREHRSLKDVLDDREMMCGEYAAITQMFFQDIGIDSEIFMGQRLAPDKNGKPNNDAEAHTFLIVRDKDHRYVFDQMLDRQIGKGVYPVIRDVPLSDKQWERFISEVRPQYEGGNPGVFPATDVFNKHVQYYGVGGTWRSQLSEKNIWNGSENKKAEGLQERLSKRSEDGKNMAQEDTSKGTLSLGQQAVLNARKPQH